MVSTSLRSLLVCVTLVILVGRAGLPGSQASGIRRMGDHAGRVVPPRVDLQEQLGDGEIAGGRRAGLVTSGSAVAGGEARPSDGGLPVDTGRSRFHNGLDEAQGGHGCGAPS